MPKVETEEIIFVGIEPHEVNPLLWEAIQKRGNPYVILQLAGFEDKIGQLLSYTYESCSFVAAFRDRKTIIDICFCPRLIEVDEDPDNPLFKMKHYPRMSARRL